MSQSYFRVVKNKLWRSKKRFPRSDVELLERPRLTNHSLPLTWEYACGIPYSLCVTYSRPCFAFSPTRSAGKCIIVLRMSSQLQSKQINAFLYFNKISQFIVEDFFLFVCALQIIAFWIKYCKICSSISCERLEGA